MSEVLIKVDDVSKKFCRDLKTGLWYGLVDLAREVTGKDSSGKHGLRSKEFWAVEKVSFEVRRGECLGVIGRNGAGKSTLLKMLNGLIKPDVGRIEMHGRIGALIELGAGFNPILTGRENIFINASVLGLSNAEIKARLDDIISFAEIEEFIDTPVQYYSSGMKVRLGFAVAAQLQPDVLILDEVLAVGDAAFRAKCFNRIHEMLKSAAVIFVSHNMPQVTRICDTLLFLEKGRQKALGSDMGSIIAQFHGAFGNENRIAVEGSGRTRIDNVKVLNESGNVVETLEFQKPFSISIDFSLLQEDRPTALRILIVLRDQEQTGVAQIDQTIDLEGASERVNASLSMPPLILNSGRYYLSLTLLDGLKGEMTSVIYNATSFVVEHDVAAYAPVLIDPVSCTTTYSESNDPKVSR